MRCEKAVEIIPDYVEQRAGAALVVALENHLRGCVACTREAQSLRDVYAMFQELPVMDPPHGFRARVLERWDLERHSEPRWAQRLFGRPATPRSWLNLAGIWAAVLLLLSLLSGAPITGVIGQSWVPKTVEHAIHALFHPSAGPGITSGGHLDFYVSGLGAGRPQLNREMTLALNLTPRTDLRDGGITIFRGAGISSTTLDVSTEDNGHKVWNGDVDANDCVQIPLKLKLTRPGVHTMVAYLGGSDRNERRCVYMPSGPADAIRQDVLAGNYNTDEVLRAIAAHFGVIIASDMVQARPRPLNLNLTTPGRTIAQFCAQRGLQWEFSDGVYNVFLPSR